MASQVDMKRTTSNTTYERHNMSNDESTDERRQSVADKADRAHTLASVTSAQLVAHAAEDQRLFASVVVAVSALSLEVKAISKWIWIATGVMLALNKGLDLLIQHH